MPWQEIIGILGTSIMAGLGILGWSRNHRLDASGSGRESASVITEIGHVKSGIEEIKTRLDRREREYIEVVGRLTAIETECKRFSTLNVDARLSSLETAVKQIERLVAGKGV